MGSKKLGSEKNFWTNKIFWPEKFQLQKAYGPKERWQLWPGQILHRQMPPWHNLFCSCMQVKTPILPETEDNNWPPDKHVRNHDTLLTLLRQPSETPHTLPRHLRLRVEYIQQEKSIWWVAGWLIPLENTTTTWLHLASWNLQDSELSWESKMEPECGKN